eukprot:380376_1
MFHDWYIISCIINDQMDDKIEIVKKKYSFVAIRIIDLVNRDKKSEWYYLNGNKEQYGPFESHKMAKWYEDEYFDGSLFIKSNPDGHFMQLKTWFRHGLTAFMSFIPAHYYRTNIWNIELIDKVQSDNALSDSNKMYEVDTWWSKYQNYGAIARFGSTIFFDCTGDVVANINVFK